MTVKFLSSVPLKYSYVLRNTKDRSGVYFESDTGLWGKLDHSNRLIANSLQDGSIDDYKIIDNSSYGTYKTQVANYRDNSEQLVNVQLYQETQEQLLNDQLSIYQGYSAIGVKTIVLSSTKFDQIFIQNEQNPELISEINSILRLHKVEMIVSLLPKSFSIAPNPRVFNKEDKYVYMIGESDKVTKAEVALRVIFDSITNVFVDTLNIPLSMIPLIAGLNFGNFKSIAKQTGANLYVPNLLPDLLNSEELSSDSDSLMYISGFQSQVQLSIKLLLDIKKDTNLKVFYKSIEIAKFKKDLLILNKLNELSTISYKHGVFIQLSPLDNQDSTIHFQGPTPEIIELAINELVQLTNDMILTRIQLDASHIAPLTDNAIERIQHNISQISLSSNCSIIFDVQSHSFQAIGFRSDLINLLQCFDNGILSLYVKELNSNNGIPILIESEIELDLIYHEFLSGKKNGKIIKVLNSSNGSSKIQFSSFNDYVFKVELYSRSVNEFILSLDNLEKEFPSEVKFFIPESFHRQIIGTGGSLIQSIMRKYNVFVKFTNQLELNSSSQTGNLVRFDNVIIRCPSKNSSNIPLVQQELNTLLSNNNENSGSILNTYVKISKSQYRLFNFEKVQKLEKANQVFVRFPTSEFDEPFQAIEVLGLDRSSITASKALITELASTYEFKVSFSTKFSKVFNERNEKFLDKLKVPLKLLYNFEILTVDHSNTSISPYHSILLTYLPESEIYLEDVSTHLTQFLRENEFMILDRNEISNNDLLINGSAASVAQTLEKHHQSSNQQLLQKQLFQFNQTNTYPNTQQLNKFNKPNSGNYPYQQEHQPKLAQASIFNNPQQHNFLAPSNNIYHYTPTDTSPAKKRNSQKQRLNFNRPF